ncbi:hypothetical protein ACFSTH_14515 [Paenibacillus yanchengensis]|uniref:Uncharacterized protein n=1 Tax=Paenibacillus yanchengensis TaxID=2035833 RepID=A0ABW4YEZ1_9BACL
MILKVLFFLNGIVFIFVVLVFTLVKFKETKQLRSILSQMGQLDMESNQKLVILDYKNPSYQEMDRLLSLNAPDIEEQIILFQSPKWLHEIKRKTWSKHKVIHASSLYDTHIKEGHLALISNRKYRVEIITEVTEYFNQLYAKVEYKEQSQSW